MLGNLLGGLFDKEQMTRYTVQSALEKAAIETESNYKDLFFMIVPTDAEFNHKYFICKWEGSNPKKIREITLKEILSEE